MAEIQVISSDSEKVEGLRAELSRRGYAVTAGPMQETLRKELLRAPPDAIIIDLSRAPATGRDLGLYLRVQKATRHSLLVYLDGKSEKVEAIRALLPDAVYTNSKRLVKALAAGLADPPSDPHIPDSVFAGYAERPLVGKLGIRAGMRVGLVDAPDSCVGLLTPLPDGVDLTVGVESAPDIVLWFTRARADLEKRLVSIQRGVGGGKLWILWPKKSSGLESDLTQPIVRQCGMDSGWVDFKVCSFDETWSGLCFTARMQG